MINLSTKPIFPLENKSWGYTQFVHADSTIAVAAAFMRANCQSSKHCHPTNFNRFHVQRGELTVIVYRNGLEEPVTLTAGMTLDVPPKIWHRMKSGLNSDVNLIEIYWNETGDPLNPLEIEREDLGGPIDKQPNHDKISTGGIVKGMDELIKEFELASKVDEKYGSSIADVAARQIIGKCGINLTEEKRKIQKELKFWRNDERPSLPANGHRPKLDPEKTLKRINENTDAIASGSDVGDQSYLYKEKTGG